MKEKEVFKLNGFIGLILAILIGTGAVLCIRQFDLNQNGAMLVIAILLAIIFVAGLTGFTIIQPNQAKVFTLFGSYLGVIKQEGFWFSVPFSFRKNVSLRVINFNSDKLKVNDLEGNPIEIAAVVVHKVFDTAKAVFDVEDIKSLFTLRVKQDFDILLANIHMTILIMIMKSRYDNIQMRSVMN